MNKFYRKPKPETMKKNRDLARAQYMEEMTWLKDNLQKLGLHKNKFLVEMYTIMVTGSRKLTDKMVSSIRDGIERCKNNPKYNPELKSEADEKYLAGVSSFQRDAARKELEAKAAKTTKKTTTTKEK